MSPRLLGFDPATGLAQWWLEDGEGNWAQKASQHVEQLLDLNREAQNHCDPYNAARDVRMVARIPLIVIAKWRNELGVDYWNPDHQAKVDALLDDADWRWLRTDGPTHFIARERATPWRSSLASTPHERHWTCLREAEAASLRRRQGGALPAMTLVARSTS